MKRFPEYTVGARHKTYGYIIWQAKFSDRGQSPYFSITGSGEYVGGMLHDEMLEVDCKAVNELHFYTRWHLFNVNRGPMHYIPNALYHLGIGEYSKYNLDYFKSTIVYGALESDSDMLQSLISFDRLSDKTLVSNWLEERYKPLFLAFDKDMRALFGDGYRLRDKEGNSLL